MRPGGRGWGSARSAASIWRFILCRVTDRRAVFLETTTAYPRTPWGMRTEICREERRRPFLRAAGNSARGSRSRRGNTAFMSRGALFRRGGGAGLSCVQRLFLPWQGTRGSLLSSFSSVYRSVWSCGQKIRLYT